MSANDLKHVSRIVPIAVAASIEAVADSGLPAAELPLDERRRFAVVIGSGGAGLEFIEKQFRQYYLDDPKGVSLYTIPSSTPGSLSSELSMKFALRGPSHVISTGCTSSTDALGHAMSLDPLRPRRSRAGRRKRLADRPRDPDGVLPDEDHVDRLERRAGAGVAAVLEGPRRIRHRRGRPG